jgi:hypothetical protein
MEEKKDFLSTFNTFILIITSIVTSYTAYRTSALNDKINNLKAISEEGHTVSTLIKDFSDDSKSTVKYDYAFLSLERYLRNTNADGELKPQDKTMLIGFAQTLIYDRFNNQDKSKALDDKILIPTEFIEKNDSALYLKIMQKVHEDQQKKVLPTGNVGASLTKVEPISQNIDTAKSKLINIILKKVVYIQYADDNMKAIALDFQKKIKSKSWNAPDIEKIPGDYSNTIRYFYDDDQYFAKEVKEVLGTSYTITKITGFEGKAPKGQIEVWINTNKK